MEIAAETDLKSTAKPPRLRMEGITKRFGATTALEGVHLSVRSGEIEALIGENGAGKSTLMKILSGAIQADEGNIWLDGEPYAPRNPSDGRAAGVAMIYQELSLAPDLSVMENITLGSEPLRGPLVHWKVMRERAATALAQLGHHDIPLQMPVERLSVAQQQLVEIARSVAIGCRVLVLDEPTSSLPQSDAQKLFALVHRLRKQGLAIVYISHFLEEVTQLCDRYTVLRDGRTVDSSEVAGTPIERIISKMVGREVVDMYPRTRREQGNVLLEIDNLAGKKLPGCASLQLHRGEVLGIAGVVGAGRTEMVRAIFGLDPVRQGAVRVGTATQIATPNERWRQGVGMVSEDRKNEGLALELSIAENATLSRLQCERSHGKGPWKWKPGWMVTPASQDRAIQPLAKQLAIKCRSMRQSVVSLSGGNQQKVALVRLLHARVDILLLDEPTRGIDVGSKTQIYHLINRLTLGDPESGIEPRGVLIISSYLPELLGICDRIAVMCRGRLGPCHEVAHVNEHQLMLEATGAEGL